MSEESPIIVDLRTKLELRTIFLRASVALNISFLGAILSVILNKVL